MRKKKYLGLALALGALVSVSGVSDAGEWKGGTIYVGGNVGDNYEVSTDYSFETNDLVGHAFGIYTNTLDPNAITRAGNNLKVEIWGAGADGVRTNYATGSPSNAPKSSGQIYIGDGLIINTYGRSADAFNINGSAYVEIGKNAKLETFYDGDLSAYEGAHGLRLNHNGTIKVDDDLTIITKGKSSHGLYGTGDTGLTFNIADNSQIFTAGNQSHAAYLTGNGAALKVGEQSYWETSGENSHGISIDKKDVTAVLGNSAEFVTSGNESYGIAVQGYYKASSKSTAEINTNAKVNIGDKAKVVTTGERSHGISMAGTNGTIVIGTNTQIKTYGNDAYGLYGHGGIEDNKSYGDDGKIEVGAGLDLRTTGINSHAVYTDWASTSVEFKGGATILPTAGTGSYAIYAKAGTITSKLDGSGNVSNSDGGNFQIFGDMKTDVGGKIDMRLGSGSLFVGSADQGAGNINLVLQNGSKWYVTQDKNADVIVETGGEMFLGDPASWSTTHFGIKNDGTLTVNGGKIHFLTDISTVTSDLYTLTNQIQGTGGVLKVASIGSAATDGTEEVVLVKGKQDATNGAATFTLENGSVDQGGYSYVLDSRVTTTRAPGREWYLRATRASGSASGGVNVFSGAYLLGYAETQTLLQRLGDLRHTESKGDLWARAYGGKFTSASDGFLSGYEMSYHGLQVGIDRKKELSNQRGDLYYGGFVGYGKGNLDYGRGNGSVDSKTLGLYGTYMKPSGFYTDLVVKHVWMKNDFSVLDSAGTSVKGGTMNTNGLSASVEIGKRYHLDRTEKQGWYVEPQMQLTVSQQNGGSFNASNGLKIDVDGYTSILGRAGLNAGYELKKGKNPVNAYFKISRVHEFDGDVDYRLNGSKESTSYGDSWWTWGIGITTQISKKHNLYFDVERSSGGQFNQPWAINGGYRFTW